MSDGFEEIVTQYSPEVETLARAAKALLQDVMPDVVEVPWVKQKTIGYGVGPKKNSEHYCYIAPFKSRINLGFMYGADLPDPNDLLEGSGKLLRHVKIASTDQLEDPALRTLVELASQHLPKLAQDD